MKSKIDRKFFIISSVESIEAIFWARYNRHFTNIERYIVKRAMMKHGVFSARSGMQYCVNFFEQPRQAVMNLGLVCRVRPE